MNRKQGKHTLLASMAMSLPGPIVLGAALLAGRSSTQLADFVRRTSELLATVISLVLYHNLYKSSEPNPVYKAKSEALAGRFVGSAMVLSALGMAFISFFSPPSLGGNVVPSLVIALLGLIANTFFAFRYTSLGKKASDGILVSQSRLYLAKALVDGTVVFTLGFAAFFPTSSAVNLIDKTGSIIISLYLFVNGLYTIKKTVS